MDNEKKVHEEVKRSAEHHILKIVDEMRRARTRLAELDEELMEARKQANCSKHQWVATVSGQPINIDTCTKCGAVYAY